MALGKHLAVRDPAAVGPALELEREIIPQKIFTERVFSRTVAVDRQADTEGDLRVVNAGFAHGRGDGRQRQNECVLLCSLILLEAQTALPNGVIPAIIIKLHLRRDEFPVACRVAGGVEHSIRGFGVVVSIVDSELDHSVFLLVIFLK
ncbi:hypothetical protein SDC9_63949 [bioreactor metagenome]|uniref:Uncharacterized protein n=1 Tax=bioreactor metagenome TaxID=1076179 RepID=A0A644XTD7_9ZZZZ